MDTLGALARRMAAEAMGARHRVFDWDQAARLIVEHKAKQAAAGLQGDWEYTGGSILLRGRPVPANRTYTYLASNWATPELELDGKRQDCWRYEDEAPWKGPKTYWPDSALAILKEAGITMMTEEEME